MYPIRIKILGNKMLFKAKFSNSIDEFKLDENGMSVDFDSVVNKEVIKFNNHQFEVERNDDALISELTYCNQCVNTFDIEEVFIELISLLLSEDKTVTLIDSSGSEENLTKDDLLDMY